MTNKERKDLIDWTQHWDQAVANEALARLQKAEPDSYWHRCADLKMVISKEDDMFRYCTCFELS